jgi:hypothetical protein
MPKTKKSAHSHLRARLNSARECGFVATSVRFRLSV